MTNPQCLFDLVVLILRYFLKVFGGCGFVSAKFCPFKVVGAAALCSLVSFLLFKSGHHFALCSLV